jgi:transposase
VSWTRYFTATDEFTQFVKELVPKVEAVAPHQCYFFMDNAGFHKREQIAPVLAASPFKHVLHFNPPNTPDFNPIEHMFNAWKAPLKRDRTDTFAALDLAVQEASKRVTRRACLASWKKYAQASL